MPERRVITRSISKRYGKPPEAIPDILPSTSTKRRKLTPKQLHEAGVKHSNVSYPHDQSRETLLKLVQRAAEQRAADMPDSPNQQSFEQSSSTKLIQEVKEADRFQAKLAEVYHSIDHDNYNNECLDLYQKRYKSKLHP